MGAAVSSADLSSKISAATVDDLKSATATLSSETRLAIIDALTSTDAAVVASDAEPTAASDAEPTAIKWSESEADDKFWDEARMLGLLKTLRSMIEDGRLDRVLGVTNWSQFAAITKVQLGQVMKPHGGFFKKMLMLVQFVSDSQSSEQLRAAASKIASADALLIFTGAGMGADSGLGTYRGVNAGHFGVDYEEICQPKWFAQDPELAWAFWARCYQAYIRSSPHAGYALLCSWGQCKARGSFVVTSNVDGHWLRSGLDERRVWEVHGSVHYLQSCQKAKAAGGADIREVWPADPDVMGALSIPEWRLSPHQPVQVQLAWGSEWSGATVAEDGKGILSADGAGQKLVNVYGLRAQPGESADLLRLAPGCVCPCRPPKLKAANLKVAPSSTSEEGDKSSKLEGAEGTAGMIKVEETAEEYFYGEAASGEDTIGSDAARPNILMFRDGAFNSARADQQRGVYFDWYEGLPADVNLVVLEVGVGTAIQKIRAMAECAAEAFERSTLIRINLDDMSHVCGGTDALEAAGRVICVRSGALKALSEIDRLMKAESSKP